MPTKDERREARRKQEGQRRRDEDATIGDQQRENERRREEAQRREEEGTVRHGPQPPERGLEGDEPFGEDFADNDEREGVIRRSSFRHVEKDRPRNPERPNEEE